MKVFAVAIITTIVLAISLGHAAADITDDIAAPPGDPCLINPNLPECN